MIAFGSAVTAHCANSWIPRKGKFSIYNAFRQVFPQVVSPKHLLTWLLTPELVAAATDSVGDIVLSFAADPRRRH